MASSPNVLRIYYGSIMDLHGSTWIYSPKNTLKKSPKQNFQLATCSSVLMLKTRRASKPQGKRALRGGDDEILAKRCVAMTDYPLEV